MGMNVHLGKIFTANYALCSSAQSLLFVPKVNCSTLGDRAFAHAAPVLWNSLPLTIRTITEAKLVENNPYNISIPGYNFVNKVSKTNAGGAGLHSANDREKFHEILKQKLEYLNFKGYEIYIIGDININFFNYNNDEQTSEFLHMLLDLGHLQIITKANRITDHSAALIDLIYINFP
ncbi:unnamed protein product [Porites lobata]|uniref:Endonuclease/exonuclease/phosphatase domain-containing protein n=1 Tax=Porites lobata TaxID=104759 RepID=A0ABN8MWK2_9CNID|nr:unnamed protein product [Porites lobata]